jgi:hypothetical protein
MNDLIKSNINQNVANRLQHQQSTILLEASQTSNVKAKSMLVTSSNIQMNSKVNNTKSSSTILISTTSNNTCNNMGFGENKNDLKKKRVPDLLPTIRFELKLEQPSSEQFSEFNYNKLVVKTLKIIKKKSKLSSKCLKSLNNNADNNTDQDQEQKQLEKKFQTINKNNLSILDSELKLEKTKIGSLLSTFRKKVVLSKEEEYNENNLLQNNGYDSFTNTSLTNNNDYDEENEDDENDTDNSIPLDLTQAKSSHIKKAKKKKNLYDFENNKYKLKDFNYLGFG